MRKFVYQRLTPAKGLAIAALVWLIILYPSHAQRLNVEGYEYRPRPLPPFSFINAQGNEVSVADYKGKVILLNFWASWCTPCVKELPDLERLQKELGKTHFKVIALSVDTQGFPQVKDFVDQLGLQDLEVFHDKGSKAFFALDLRGLPYSVVVDKTGKEALRLKGLVDWNNSDINLVLNDLISYTDFDASATN